MYLPHRPELAFPGERRRHLLAALLRNPVLPLAPELKTAMAVNPG